ncbi:MAG TPA: hypothetical protein ENJ00_03720 [Phycisphaerales bacterium]|nr:hypothetical protein [Phycisphaerales bacterium]
MQKLMVLIVIGLSGCAGSGREASPSPGIWAAAERPPRDLAIEVTVFDSVGEQSPSLGGSARFVIEPDGQLRAEIGDGVSLDHLPPRTRLLSDAQMVDVYHRLVRSGLDGGLDGSPLPSRDIPETIRPRVVISVVAHDARSEAMYDPTSNPAVVRLVGRLRSLARLRD